MNAQKACAPTGKPAAWESIDWKTAAREVKRLQMRIAKAQRDGKYSKAKSLQWMLTHSFYAKVLAVKRVTEDNKGKRTPGVDGELWLTPLSKAKGIAKLSRRGYTPQPLRRVYIEKGNGKKRPLGIPTMRDRAMQTLYRMALEPVAETTADPCSYGFRPCRSTHDAIERCFSLLSHKVSPQWILEGDIKGCFDHISHDWLLAHIPMDRTILRKWLKCGILENGDWFPTEEGTPQGGAISPLLANMTLDGLQQMLRKRFRYDKAHNYRTNMVNMVRYADDFIITGRSKELLENEVLLAVEEFLAERGLELSREKTSITDIRDGFDFLGQNLRKYNGTLLTKPSKKSVNKFLSSIRATIKANLHTPQHELLFLLNPRIRGWVNYHKHAVSKQTFSTIDHEIWQCLWRWAKRRHPSKSSRWIAKRYFYTIGVRSWNFAVKIDRKQKDSQPEYHKLIWAADTPIRRFVEIKTEANPYDPKWSLYFEERENAKMLYTLRGYETMKRIFLEQKGICPVCGERITAETGWASHKGAAKRGTTIMHPNCHKQLHSPKSSDEPAFLTEGFAKA